MSTVDLYRTVRLIRRFEERAIEFVRSGEIVGGIHPYIGQEAIAAGVCAALRPDDVITSTHRGHGHVLAKGVNPARMFAELMGRETGLNKGRGGSMHAADFGLGILGANAIVGAAGSIATGAAWAHRRKGKDVVAVSFFGDGAMNEGMLLEAFNLAALWQVPVLFVCENNGYATTMPVARRGGRQHHRPGQGVRDPGLHDRRPGPGEGAGGNHCRRRPGPGRARGRRSWSARRTGSTRTTRSSTGPG